MVLQRFLRILPISTHFHVNIFIVLVVVEIKLNKETKLNQTEQWDVHHAKQSTDLRMKVKVYLS